MISLILKFVAWYDLCVPYHKIGTHTEMTMSRRKVWLCVCLLTYSSKAILYLVWGVWQAKCYQTVWYVATSWNTEKFLSSNFLYVGDLYKTLTCRKENVQTVICTKSWKSDRKRLRALTKVYARYLNMKDINISCRKMRENSTTYTIVSSNNIW